MKYCPKIILISFQTFNLNLNAQIKTFEICRRDLRRFSAPNFQLTVSKATASKKSGTSSTI